MEFCKSEKCSDSYKLLHLYGFMILSGSIGSDKPKGDTEKFEKRSIK